MSQTADNFMIACFRIGNKKSFLAAIKQITLIHLFIESHIPLFCTVIRLGIMLTFYFILETGVNLSIYEYYSVYNKITKSF